MKEQKTKQVSLNLLFFKNTIAILIPTLIIFGIICFITNQYPILYQMTCRQVGSLQEMEEWYGQECYNVKINDVDIKYTGYDYYEDEKQTGAYYYAFWEDSCIFFLIKTKEPEPFLENINLKGKLIKNSAGLDAMKGQFLEDLGLDQEAFESIVFPIMVSEIDYPHLEIFLMWLLIIIPYIVTISIIILSVLWTIQPYRHPSARALSEFGDRRLVYEEIRSQVKNRLVRHNYDYYLTEEYLIINHIAKTDFVRVDFIRYMSRHVIQKMNGKRQVYRLSMSNPEKMFYEVDFDSKECTDEIMEALIQLNPKIDNRTMKVFQVKEEAQEQVLDSQEITQETALEDSKTLPEEADDRESQGSQEEVQKE